MKSTQALIEERNTLQAFVDAGILNDEIEILNDMPDYVKKSQEWRDAYQITSGKYHDILLQIAATSKNQHSYDTWKTEQMKGRVRDMQNIPPPPPRPVGASDVCTCFICELKRQL